MFSRYVPNKLLIAHKSRLLYTYNAYSIRDLAFDIEICIVAFNRQIVNTRLDRPLKPGIRNKTLRTVLRFQIEISRLMCICWHLFFNRYIYFCVFYILHYCVVIFFWSSGIMEWKWSSAQALGGVSGVASFITTDELLQ